MEDDMEEVHGIQPLQRMEGDVEQVHGVQPLQVTGVLIESEMYNRFSHYVARSWVERIVLDEPPAPVPGRLVPLPVSRATVITDRVGRGLTSKDCVVCMQNNIADNLWDLAYKMQQGEVQMDFRYIIVQIGLDWCLDAKKKWIKEGLKRVLYTVDRLTKGWAVVGVVGITPRLGEYDTTKVKTVTFNQCLAQAVRDCQHQYRVQFLPWHLHFLESDGALIQPVHRYFTKEGEYTLAGGMVLRESLLKAIRVIPMDGEH